MRIIYTLILALICNGIFAQTEIINNPIVISNAGDTWITDDYNLSFTVGELAI